MAGQKGFILRTLLFQRMVLSLYPLRYLLFEYVKQQIKETIRSIPSLSIPYHVSRIPYSLLGILFFVFECNIREGILSERYYIDCNPVEGKGYNPYGYLFNRVVSLPFNSDDGRYNIFFREGLLTKRRDTTTDHR